MPSSSTLSPSLPTGTRRHPAYTHSQASVSFCFVMAEAVPGFEHISFPVAALPAVPSPASNARVLSRFHRPVSSVGGLKSGQCEGFLRNSSLRCCHGLSFLSASAALGCDLPGPAEQASVWMGTCWWLWARQVASFIHSCCPQPWP